MFEDSVPLAHYLTLSAVLFVIGIVGHVRRVQGSSFTQRLSGQ